MASGAIGQKPAETAGATDNASAFATYRLALRAFVARRIADRDEVDDLVQEACTRLIDRARDGDVAEPQAYLFRIAANLIADRHRRAPPTVQLDDTAVPVRAAQEDGQRYRDLQHALEAALAELSPRCRQVFVMRRFDDLSTGEIAAELRISPRMVQKHLVQAMAHLYQRLGPLRENGQ